jgi:hypothetical protein
MAGEVLSVGDAAKLAVTGRGDLKPRFRLKVGTGGRLKMGPVPETIVTFPISAYLVKNNFNTADRFEIVSSLYYDPEQSLSFWAPELENTGGLGDGINVLVEIMFEGLTDWKQVFRGAVDKLELDTHRGTVKLTGRNFLALTIDSQKQVAYGGKTVREVVTEILESHLLKPDFGTDQTGLDEVYGQVVGDEKNNVTPGAGAPQLGEYDTLSKLAQFLGRTLYEENGVVYMHVEGIADVGVWTCQNPEPIFGNAGRPQAGTGHVTKLSPSNSVGLKFTHDFQYSFISQTVGLNYHKDKPNLYVSKYPEKLGDEVERRYYMETFGLAKEDVDRVVKNTHNIMVLREWICEWKVSGPDYLDVKLHDIINVTKGMGSFIEGTYVVTSMVYDISFKGGFHQTITGVWGKTENVG